MNKTKQRVLLGMSGGVDSSVAGYLLREQGYEVIGVTMKVWPQDCISRAEDKCCGPQAVADARGVAHALGIPHYVVDEADQFERVVIDYFASEYQAGRTPNPCVMCNEKLKFGNLWSKARALGCDYIATGHYAIIEHHDDRAVLRKGVDPRKDQSYFLFSLRQPQLRRALTPLGTMTKPQIREIARSLGLKVADKIDSQEICFVPGNDYKAFLRSHLGEDEFHRGEIYDVDGKLVGEHDGHRAVHDRSAQGAARRFAAPSLRCRSRSGNKSRHRRRCRRPGLRGVRNRSRELASCWQRAARARHSKRRSRSDIIIPGRLRQLRYWRTIAPMCDCMSLSAPSRPGKLRSFTMQILS